MRRLVIARLSLATTAALAIALVSGCSHQSPLVGKWSNTTGQYSQVMEFGSNGSWSADTANNLTHRHANMTGTYKDGQGSFTVYQTSTVLNGVRVPLTSQISAPQVFKYTLDGNTLTLLGRRSIEFTREQ